MQSSTAVVANPPAKLACKTCRAKKIRCDGEMPCVHCSISKVVCEYPTEIKKRGPKSKSVDLLG